MVGVSVATATGASMSDNNTAEKVVARGKKVQRKCRRCHEPFMARVADVKRGWGKFCGKSCKAITQEKQTGQHRAYMERRNRHYEGTFSNAHQFSNEEHDCNKGE